jgi:hypothetical protein
MKMDNLQSKFDGEKELRQQDYEEFKAYQQANY